MGVFLKGQIHNMLAFTLSLGELKNSHHNREKNKIEEQFSSIYHSIY